MTRPVVKDWHCCRSGDCCRSVSAIVMTPEEAEVLKAVRPELTFYSFPDNRFVYLTGLPCPLLQVDAKWRALCSEYERRPYNCRRFGCFRPDPRVEPYEPEAVDYERGRLGCANLSDRLVSRQVRREYATLQRKGQRWALRHGWSQQDAPTPVGSNVVFYRLTPRTTPQSVGRPDAVPHPSHSADKTPAAAPPADTPPETS